MGKRHEKADQQTIKALRKSLTSWHPDLELVGIRIGVVFVWPAINADGLVIGPALKYAGAMAAAKTQICRHAIRALTGLDVVIQIAADIWASLAKPSRLALLDHELEHLVVVRDNDGKIRTHNDGRPRLVTRPDDWVLTGFQSVVERQGAHALEVLTLLNLRRPSQRPFEFMDPPPAARKRALSRKASISKDDEQKALTDDHENCKNTANDERSGLRIVRS